MTLGAILLGTLAAGIGSVWLAALLSFGALARYTQHMLSLAAGALLATAFMHLLPEAFESAIAVNHLFLVLLVGLVFFFLLDKAELWHHGHEHHHDSVAHPHDHGHGHAHGAAATDAQGHVAHHHPHPRNGPTGQGGGSWAVLAGDSVHCFGDGILIASAFIADLRLGVIAALAVLAHEVPHHMGDLMVLRAGSDSRRAALVKVSLAGAVTMLGGVVGYFLVVPVHDLLPYFLVVASSSFIYVALADLIPQLQTRLGAHQTATQIAWLLGGIALVSTVSSLAHVH
ncbi:MAG: ZIP family metal transporter [Rhodoferax sp.]|nr:ZIP family metal transporter [Rhodoferax sp.]